MWKAWKSMCQQGIIVGNSLWKGCGFGWEKLGIKLGHNFLPTPRCGLAWKTKPVVRYLYAGYALEIHKQKMGYYTYNRSLIWPIADFITGSAADSRSIFSTE